MEQCVRFDDSLKTVLSADQTPGLGAESTWRQLVDLIARGRIDTTADNLARLAGLRPIVPVTVRAATARALAIARPPAELVALFADDEPAIAAIVLRVAVIPADEWLDLIGRLSPAGRAVLRQRRDLPLAVVRGLESLGSVDFRLSSTNEIVDSAVSLPTVSAEDPADIFQDKPLADTARVSTPFMTAGDVSRALPPVAPAPLRPEEAATPSRFEIGDLVQRIDAFNRSRREQPDAAAAAEDGFRFETDTDGVIRWVDGVARAALVGVSLVLVGGQDGLQGLARVDAATAPAFRQRSRFTDLRLEVGGLSDAAGSWRIAGAPRFDAASGRFTGYYGKGRRPFRHETAAAVSTGQKGMSDGLRQLVHELRTPANAVVGFAELIETELLGPVPDVYRRRANAIRTQAADLLAAIDDLDTAARIEGGALDLRPAEVPLGELIARTVADLAPLAQQRHATLAVTGDDAIAATDDRVAERLFARLLASLISAAHPGERIGIAVRAVGQHAVVTVDRPRSLADLPGDALFRLDGMTSASEDGTPLLGAGFTLRLVRNLATELGGALTIEADRLTLRLPAALKPTAEHAAGH